LNCNVQPHQRLCTSDTLARSQQPVRGVSTARSFRQVNSPLSVFQLLSVPALIFMSFYDDDRLRKGSDAPPGFMGLEILRKFVENRGNMTALLGAFRGQCVYPMRRLKGMGTYTGPLNLESGSGRLTLNQFRAALMELGIILPERESKTIFNVMSVAGTIGISDLMREVRLEPCDRSARWGQQYPYPVNQEVPNAIVEPTKRSGYTQESFWARPMSAAVTKDELKKVKEDWAGRVAPTLSSGYVASVPQHCWMRQPFDGDKLKDSPKKIDDGSQAAAMFMLGPPRTRVATGLLHPSENDPSRWDRDGIGRKLLKPEEMPARAAPAEGSGYTRDQDSIKLGPTWPDEPLKEKVWRMADSNDPWTSGYNRSNREGVKVEAWPDGVFDRDGIGRKPLPMTEFDPNVKVEPTLSSGYVHMCSICQANRALKSGVCAFCRV